MRKRLFLLSGWGLGVAPLQPLADVLRGVHEGWDVQVVPLPELRSTKLEDWLDALDSSLPEDCWLGGWSLGGMLATGLAARRQARCCGLVTLACNPCFVARDDWPDAMSRATFAAFRDGCRDSPVATLKRFALLCAQGARDPRNLGRLLVSTTPVTQAESLMAGLALLETADIRPLLKQFCGPQLHLLAAGDALVPSALADALPALQPRGRVAVFAAASHAFALERPEEVATAIAAFLREVRYD